MDEHHLCLPDELSPDGLISDELTALLIDEMDGWSFWRDDDRNMVMLVNEDD